MILYHASFLEIVQPDLVHSRLNVDFGRGFYVAPLYEQAAKWCGKFKISGENSRLFISEMKARFIYRKIYYMYII